MKNLHKLSFDYIFEKFPFESSNWSKLVHHQTANILFEKNICPEISKVVVKIRRKKSRGKGGKEFVYYFQHSLNCGHKGRTFIVFYWYTKQSSAIGLYTNKENSIFFFICSNKP
jgi:hypothetical protein